MGQGRHWIGLLALLCGVAAACPVYAQEREVHGHAPLVVGYLPTWRIKNQRFDTDRIGPVTDLVYFSAQVSQSGSISVDTLDAEMVKRAVAFKRKKDCRLLLCVGGWKRSEHFPSVAMDPDKTRVLIKSLLDLCGRYGFDGVDYDWEHPKNDKELQAYASLIEATAKVFRPRGLLVTVAQASWQDLGKRAYQALDRVHLMCYDQPFPQATMDHAKQEVQRLVKWGCPKEKITLGIPFYGRNAQRQSKTYADLVKNTKVWDPSVDQHEGYAFNGPDTVQAKTEFALESGLAGVMIWELGQDLPGPHSLISAIERGLAAGQQGDE